MRTNPIDEPYLSKRINRASYYLVSAIVILIGLLFLAQGLAQFF